MAGHTYICRIDDLGELITKMNKMKNDAQKGGTQSNFDYKPQVIDELKKYAHIKWFLYCDQQEGNTIRLYDKKFRENFPRLFANEHPNHPDYYVILRGNNLGYPNETLKKNIRHFMEERWEKLKDAHQEGLSTNPNSVEVCLSYFEKLNTVKTNGPNGKNEENVSDEIKEKYKELTEETFLEGSFFDTFENLLLEHRQVILEGAPGSGKTFVAENFAEWWTSPKKSAAGPGSRREVIQFHESYGYEDFFQGIKPVLLDREGQKIGPNDTTTPCHEMVYENVPGIFYKFCEEARNNANARFVLIIDEINRGKASRIFGELLYLLEYRDKKIQLASSEPFSIPKNVYIIGTMNTADRSIALVDYALRRRFKFVALHPVCFENGDAPVLRGWLEHNKIEKEKIDYIVKIFCKLNETIVKNVNEHLVVGHSYFMTCKLKENLQDALDEIWDFSIMPLMSEYQPNLSTNDLKKQFGLDVISGNAGVKL